MYGDRDGDEGLDTRAGIGLAVDREAHKVRGGADEKAVSHDVRHDGPVDIALNSKLSLCSSGPGEVSGRDRRSSALRYQGDGRRSFRNADNGLWGISLQ
jgi:hypothetical protein